MANKTVKGNKYLNGVNWSSLKKFAEFHFLEKNFKTGTVIQTNDGRKFFKIFIDRNCYYENEDEARRFETRFGRDGNLEVLPMD